MRLASGKILGFRILGPFNQRTMKSISIVKVPVPAYQCNLVVFPAPACNQDNSQFYVFHSKEDIFADQVGHLKVEYISGMIYCFLPSGKKRKGVVTMYSSKPDFIDTYSVCLVVKVMSLIWKKIARTKSMMTI